jgi:hypothetical protein
MRFDEGYDAATVVAVVMFEKGIFVVVFHNHSSVSFVFASKRRNLALAVIE